MSDNRKKRTPRRVAFEALIATERGAYANLALNEAILSTKSLTDQDKAFASALFYMTIERRLTISFYLRQLAHKRIPTVERCVLLLGGAQLLYMDIPARAAIDESVKLAREVGKQNTTGFINGVLRNLDRMRDQLPLPEGTLAERLSIEFSYPVWLVERFMDEWGEDETRALLAYQGNKDVCIRTNPIKSKVEEIDQSLASKGITYRKGKLFADARYLMNAGNIASDELFDSGQITIQGESSMLTAYIAGVRPGMRVLDACAAPGGKTMFMAAQVGDGEIHAWDVHPHRVELIRKNAQRMGAEINTSVQDASVYQPEYDSFFDIVLVDAPCSGLGIMNAKPDIKYAKSPEAIEELYQLQRKILDNCQRYVVPGGKIIYSTCTMTREENQGNVDWFLKGHPDFLPDTILSYFPDHFDQTRLKNGQVQLLPHRDGVDGFFVAKMQRILKK